MGKTGTTDKIDAQVVEVGGRKLVIMDEEEYERLLDALDAAEAERILNDPNTRMIPWEEVRKELLRNRIAEVRKQLGVTQKELARRLKVKQSTVSRMERPDANLTLATLRRVAKALRRPVHELLK